MFIDKHPELLHKPAREVFADAVTEAKLLIYTPEKIPVVHAKQ